MGETPVLEIIATSAADAAAAEAGGADRIELVSAMSEGGLTPSCGIIEQVAAAVAIPVYVMIRPHSRSFCFSSDEIRAISADIRTARSLGASGIVVGALIDCGMVDEAALREWIGAAEGLPVTFHRAFDESENLERALETIARYPEVRRILTSGGKPSALEAADDLKRLALLGETLNIAVMAGAGLKVETLESFVRQTGVREVHFGSGVRYGGSFRYPVDPELVAKAKQALRSGLKEVL
ncbi:copper homeostasis protein CutC [Paenibacillus tarimensis]